MSYKDSIYRWFINSNRSGCCYIGGLPEGAEAQYYRDGESYGVMLATDDPHMEIDERFSNVRLYTSQMSVGNEETETYLVLSCRLSGENYSEKFATMCDDFIDPGTDGYKRIAIINDPFSWWSEWKKLIGNVSSDKKPYSILGELISFDHLLKAGEEPIWEGADSGTVDIRARNFDCEVKSTTIRSNRSVSVSSIHQLDGRDKPLHLYHCCFERSDSGISINDMLTRLRSHGADMDGLERRLESLGYSRGSSGRMIKYRLLTMNDYLVDDSFPKITLDSFRDAVLPLGIESITYIVSLADVKSVAVDYR